MTNAFVCCTPYHVLLSLHLACNVLPGGRHDLYISDHFSSARGIYERLRASGPFRMVRFVKDKELSYDKSRLQTKKMVRFLNGSLDFIEGPLPNMGYDQLFLFTNSFFSHCLVNAVKKENRQACIHLVEEGIMTYLLEDSTWPALAKRMITKAARLARIRFLGLDEVSSVHVFKPDMFAGSERIRKKLCKLPELKRESAFLEEVNRVFDYKPQPAFAESPYILFDQSFGIDGNRTIRESQVIQDMTKLIGSDRMLVKLHPRDSMNKYAALKLGSISNSHYPWEIIYLNEALSDKVLLAVTSSAVLTPYVMFNCRNPVVVMNKLYGLKRQNFDKLIDNLKSVQSTNMFVPTSMLEMEGLIRAWDNEGRKASPNV